MNKLWQWFLAHGDWLLTAAGGILAIPPVQAALSSSGWWPVALAAAAVFHITVLPEPTPATAPTVQPAAKQGGFAHVRLLAALAILAALPGCATLANWFGNQTVQAAVQLSIDVGVGLVLQKNPAEAAPLQVAATALQQLATGNATTVQTFVADADAKIAAMPSINAPEKLALEQVVELAASALTTGSQKLSPTASVDLGLIFGDIANAAQVFAAAKPAS
jgi:hypothetical protein